MVGCHAYIQPKRRDHLCPAGNDFTNVEECQARPGNQPGSRGESWSVSLARKQTGRLFVLNQASRSINVTDTGSGIVQPMTYGRVSS